MDKTTELLTASELARRLRVSTDTVRTWSRQGVIPTVRLSPKVVRYDADAVISSLTCSPSKGVSRAD